MEGLRPLYDPTFAHLAQRALKGDLRVFYATIPRQLIRRFDPDYDPRGHPIGRVVVDEVKQDWQKGNWEPLWVYETVGEFVMSDNYIQWAAAEEGQPDYLPCWVLGRPSIEGSIEIQGPIAVQEVRRLLGLAEPSG